MPPMTRLLTALVSGLLAAGTAWGQTVCPLTQVTDTTMCGGVFVSVDGGAVAFESTCDLTGGNPDASQEIFLFDGATFVQVTTSSGCGNLQPSLSGGDVAFVSTCDLTAGNPGGQLELFLFDGSMTVQVTSLGSVLNPSADAGGAAFVSAADHAGNNADGNIEIFLFDGVTISQVTNSAGACQNMEPSLEGGAVAFRSNCDLTGTNPDGNIEVFLFDGMTISQVTDTSGCGSLFFNSFGWVDLDGGVVAFATNCNLTGGNADGNFEIFQFDGTTFAQRTSTSACNNTAPRLDGGVVGFSSSCTADGSTHVFVSDGVTSVDSTPGTGCSGLVHGLSGGTLALTSQCDLTGSNPDGNPEIFLGACRPASVVEVPAVGPVGLAALALLLVAAGWLTLRRAA